jgi:hypothetical protein
MYQWICLQEKIMKSFKSNCIIGEPTAYEIVGNVTASDKCATLSLPKTGSKVVSVSICLD